MCHWSLRFFRVHLPINNRATSPRYLTFNSKGNEGIGDNDNDHDNEADRDVDDGDGDGDDNGDLSINTQRGRLLF